MIELSVSDGSRMQAYLASPSRANGAGIIVFQEAFGVDEHMGDICERFAALGITAIAPELFHRTAPGFKGSYNDFEQIRPHMAALTNEGLEADASAAFNQLANEKGVDAKRIAAVGYCMGGRVTYTANAALPLAAAISYYGGGIAPALLDRARRQHGPLLMFWGGKDSHIPPDQYRAVADALTSAEKTHEQVVFSQAGHAFFNDRRESYEETAARQSWALSLEFLRSFGVL